jgi:hypothetical protein
MGKIDFGRVITAEENAAAAAEALRERIRQRRDRAMNAGVVVCGMLVHTDDISQQRILGAAVAIMRDPTLNINWKTADGVFFSLNAEAVLAVADAVRAHVQACYDREAELLAAIGAGVDVDLEGGWPA